MKGRGGGLETNRQQKVGTEPPAAGEPEQRSRRAGRKMKKLKILLTSRGVQSALLDIYTADDAVPAGATSRSRREASKCQSSFLFFPQVSVTQEHQSEHVSVSSDEGSRYSSTSPQDVTKREDLLHARRLLRVHPTSSGCLNRTLAGVGSLIISFECFPKFNQVFFAPKRNGM